MNYQIPDKMALLGQAARRLAEDPAFMSWVLARFAQSDFEAKAIAAILHVHDDAVIRLALCKRPRRDPQQFRLDVEAIAHSSGVPATTIASVVRRVDSLAALQDTQSNTLMAAARDDLEPEVPGPTHE